MQEVTTSNQKKRSSNFELLRIVAMLMILSLHSFPTDNECYTYSLATGVDFFREACCISAVNCYVLISGYFTIKWKKKSFCSLVYQVMFWLLLIYVLALIVGLQPLNMKELLRRINGIVNAYWFITTYLILYLIAPVLNAFIEKSTERELGCFLVIFYTVQTYFSLLFSEIFGIGCGVMSFAGLYMVGAFFKKNGLPQKVRQLKIGLYSVVVIMTLIITAMLWLEFFVLGCDMLKVKTSFWGLAYNNPLIICQSIAIFLLFSSFTFQSKRINTIATSILAVYLFHMHPDVKQWYYDYTRSLYGLSLSNHYIRLALLFLLVFVVAILIDRIRLFTFSFLYNRLISNQNEI